MFYFLTRISPLYTVFLSNDYTKLYNSKCYGIKLFNNDMYSELTLKKVSQISLYLIIVNTINIILLNVMLALISFYLYKISYITNDFTPGIFIELNYYTFTNLLAEKL
ncbi:hypothetical protein [Anaerococcus provencensis]|uniref:hypothetical protein n=1 Tax=Anaerococcus provencensis TaxID=938293 RepID=UPI0005C94463|nr:hypothetical protein [Anaerococcus provencensis]